jgi:hypothetical protein
MALEWKRVGHGEGCPPDWKAETERGTYRVVFAETEDSEWETYPDRYYAEFWLRDKKPMFTDEQAEAHFEAYGETITREDREVHPDYLGRFDIDEDEDEPVRQAKEACENHATEFQLRGETK